MAKQNEIPGIESDWRDDSEVEWSSTSEQEWDRSDNLPTWDPHTGLMSRSSAPSSSGRPRGSTVTKGQGGNTGKPNVAPLPTIPLTHELVAEMVEVHGKYIISRLGSNGVRRADAEDALQDGAVSLLNAIGQRNKLGLPHLMVTVPKLYLLRAALRAVGAQNRRTRLEFTLTEERWNTEVEWASGSSEWEQDVTIRLYVEAVLGKAKLGKKEAEQVDMVVEGHDGRGTNGEGAPANERQAKKRGLGKVRSVLVTSDN